MKTFTACFILLFSVVIFSHAETLHWNKGRGYSPFRYATQAGILIENSTDSLVYDYFSLPYPSHDFKLKFRAKNINGHPARKYPYLNSHGKTVNISNPHWGFFLTTNRDTVAITLKGGEKSGAFEPTPSLDVTFYYFSTKKSETLSLTDKINPYDGDNLWQISVTENNFSIAAGNRDLNIIYQSHNTFGEVSAFGFFAGWGDALLVSDIRAEYQSPSHPSSTSHLLIENISEYLASSDDELEGYWTIFDRELEESLIKLGGDYTLACIKDQEGYIFCYLEGATVNSKEWEKGDVKMKLTPTAFPGIFDVEWIDASKELMSHQIKAQRGEGNTLSIQFPYQASRLRLRKIDQ